MASYEMALISRIIRTGELKAVIEWGITPQDFLTKEAKGYFNHLIGYYYAPNTKQSVLGPSAFRQQYENFEFVDDPSMTLDALCFEVRKRRKKLTVKQLGKELIEMADVDPDKAAAHAQNILVDVARLDVKGADLGLSTALDYIVAEYEARERGENPSIANWPWAPLNDATLGVQPDDYVVLYGRPKSMKSWVLTYLIACFFMDGKRVLIYTKEMTPHNIFKRIAACILGIPYQDLRAATLTAAQKNTLYSLQEELQSTTYGDRLVCISGQESGGRDGIPWLQAKIEKHAPDIVCVDGLYLMSDFHGAKKREERVANISRDARQMVLSTQVPLICTLQANRKAAAHSRGELDEIAYSDAIGQDATIAMRVINDKTTPTISLVMAGSREFQLHGFRINGMPATDFTFKEVLTEKDILKAEEGDTAEADSPKAHRKLRTPATNADKAATKQLLHNQLNKLS